MRRWFPAPPISPLQSGETYYVSGEVYLSGLTTIAGGAVIKYDTNYVCGVNILGTVNCATSPNQPAILTSADDNTVGEAITTGGPNNGTGSLTLWVTGDSGVNLANLKFGSRMAMEITSSMASLCSPPVTGSKDRVTIMSPLSSPPGWGNAVIFGLP